LRRKSAIAKAASEGGGKGGEGAEGGRGREGARGRGGEGGAEGGGAEGGDQEGGEAGDGDGEGLGRCGDGEVGGHPREREEGELQEGEGDPEAAGEEECPGGEEAEEEERDDVGALVEQGAEGVEHERQPEGERKGEPREGEGVAGEVDEFGEGEGGGVLTTDEHG
jgi:hypothetical protein